MTRGKVIPQLRQQLFAAAELVIERDGPARLSGRSVTTTANVSSGLLYAHFTDFDDFLIGFAVDRSFTIGAAAAKLRQCQGPGDVATQLSDCLLAIPPRNLSSLTRLLAARPDLTLGTRAILGDQLAGLDAVEQAVAEYFAKQQRDKRLSQFVDTAALALAVIGVLHHLVLSAADAEIADRLRPTLAAVLADSATVS